MNIRWVKVSGRPQSAQGKNKKSKKHYREYVATCARQQCLSPLKGNLSICLFYVFNPIPGRDPDIDNLNKIILDSLKGIVYADDSQIHVARSEKHYCGRPTVSSAPIMPPAGALQEAVEIKIEECIFVGVTDAKL